MRDVRARAIKILSWLLLGGGIIFLISGARDFLVPIIGQHEIAAKWEAAKIDLPPAAAPTGSAVCRLLIPRLDAHFFVVEGSDHDELRLGPGHMHGSALPGQNGNCIIAGHRDTHFRMLKDLRKGDDIVLQTRTGEYHYQVKSLSIVSPEDNEALQGTSSPVLSLITCYPFYYVGPAPKRFVVQAGLNLPVPVVAVEPAKGGVLQSQQTQAVSPKPRRPGRAAKSAKAAYHSSHSAPGPKHENIVKRVVNRLVKRLHPSSSAAYQPNS